MKRMASLALAFLLLFSGALAEGTEDILYGDGSIEIRKDILSGDSTLTLGEHLDVKKNYSIRFSCEADSFSGLHIGHGYRNYASSYLIIDEETISVYSYHNTRKQEVVEQHGLDIYGCFTVTVDVQSARADITLETPGGSYRLHAVWVGCHGDIYATCIDSVMRNCRLTLECRDAACPVWIFGDSYFTLETDARIPYHLQQMGYDNWLACGYPGAKAETQIPCFERLLKTGKPKIAVFAMGMNNPDKGAANPKWLQSVQAFLALCDMSGVEPVLCLLPSAPGTSAGDSDVKTVRDNSYKNQWIRESGRRYVDFGSAVTAGDGSGWLEGMLAKDGVHPTPLGAEALAVRLLEDCPEIGGGE